MRGFTILIFLFIHCYCLGQHEYAYQQPSVLEDGWEVTSLRAQKVDTTRIQQLFSQLFKGEHKVSSILVVKNDQLILDEYFNGHATNKPHDLRSVTKSVRSILLGIAIDRGFIDSVDDPIFKYLKSHVPKKNLDRRKEAITIRHLITMSTGFDCDDWNPKSKGQEDRVYKKRDWIQYTLDLPMVNDPGTVSNYCSMGVLLLAEIISQASGMTIDQFAKIYLFKPLGITNVKWSHTSNKKVLPSGKRLYMCSRDIAKIGQLVLKKGRWNNSQLVSKAWIAEATATKTKITGIDYGYLWWNIPFRLNEQVIMGKVATGNGGQYIMVFPELEMVTVFTGSAYNSQEDKLPFVIMREVFLPTFNTK